MKAVYFDSTLPEKAAVKRFNFPEFVMMENAAKALEDCVLGKANDLCAVKQGHAGKGVRVLILCGTGNNGGDGYALARRLFGKSGVEFVKTAFTAEPKTKEAEVQRKMALAVGVPEGSFEEVQSETFDIIVDCIYGTGFHGVLDDKVLAAVEWANGLSCIRIACDVPSGLAKNGVVETVGKSGSPVAFCADATVTMGALKACLFSDTAKDFAGDVIVADLGISSACFESCAVQDAYLIEENDTKFPVRNKKSAHKGNYGHGAVVLGEKSGAGIIAGTAALQFGAGLVSVVDYSLCKQNFAMNPELMAGKSFPEKCSAVLLGSGLGRGEQVSAATGDAFQYICKMEQPAAVFDADFFYSEKLESMLNTMERIPNARIILTPHPKELCRLAQLVQKEVSEKDVILHRLEWGMRVSEKFRNLTLIAKGANNYIFSQGQIFIVNNGCAALAKAGSGDVLAGMCLSLLAQGYSAKEAAITAVWVHGNASWKFQENFSCSPLKLIEKL